MNRSTTVRMPLSITRSLLLSTVIAIGAWAGSTAQAADLNQAHAVSLEGSLSSGYTAAATAVHGEAGSFLDTFRFTVAKASLVDVSLVTIGQGHAQQISFTEAWLNGMPLDIAVMTGADGSRQSYASLFATPLSGDVVLTVKGVAGGALEAGTAISASYSGTFNVMTSPVPEPERHAMFLGGLGMVALMLASRRRRGR